MCLLFVFPFWCSEYSCFNSKYFCFSDYYDCYYFRVRLVVFVHIRVFCLAKESVSSLSFLFNFFLRTQSSWMYGFLMCIQKSSFSYMYMIENADGFVVVLFQCSIYINKKGIFFYLNTYFYEIDRLMYLMVLLFIFFLCSLVIF